ncbi:MAG: hypothetical protein HGA96_15505 [Desulfobulbaceae bacterium]|nr:hypothetical protein [Desulfobulbaceae bacterium]
MQPSIAEALTVEIKQDLANRYFGFRKLIEEDKLALADKIRQHAFILEKRISFDLIRIYILLRDEGLIGEFLVLGNIPAQLFYDPYLAESATIRQRVFAGLSIRGLTRKGRFANTLVDCYERLCGHVGLYREKFAELEATRDQISSEIAHFYKNNDLGSILSFLRSLGDATLSGAMQGGMELDMAQDLDRKLRIEPPEPVTCFLPVLAPLPPVGSVKVELNSLIDRAFIRQGQDFHDYLAAQTLLGRLNRRFLP